MIKESGKFVINDLEMMIDQDKKAKLTGKRQRVAIAKDHESDDASSQGDNGSDEDSESDQDTLKKRIR